MPHVLPFRLEPPVDGPVDVLIIAGEHSGDQHAARMVRELRSKHPQIKVAALGGPELAAAGAQLLYDLTESSVVGLVEVLKNISFFFGLSRRTLLWIVEHRPRVVCFIDYPGFNLDLAKTLHKRRISIKGGGDVKTVFYISPQIWAWKAARRFKMAKHLDALAVIFPFEPKHYVDTDLPVEFVGHPFVSDGYESPVRYDPSGPILLLPGSRKQAVSRIFPVMLAGFRAYGEREAIALFPSDEIETVLKEANPPPSVRLLRTGQPVAASAVLTSSGTMSMHCALAGIPGAVVYRASRITYWLGRWLVKVPYLGIANLLLGRPMYPEYIQNSATPKALARELTACVNDPARHAQTEADAAQLRLILQQPATGTAADWLAREIEGTARS